MPEKFYRSRANSVNEGRIQKLSTNERLAILSKIAGTRTGDFRSAVVAKYNFAGSSRFVLPDVFGGECYDSIVVTVELMNLDSGELSCAIEPWFDGRLCDTAILSTLSRGGQLSSVFVNRVQLSEDPVSLVGTRAQGTLYEPAPTPVANPQGLNQNDTQIEVALSEFDLLLRQIRRAKRVDFNLDLER